MATSQNGSSAGSNGRGSPSRGSPRSNGSRKQISDSSTADDDAELGRSPAKNENPKQPQDASKSPDKTSNKDARKILLISAVVVILLGLIIGLSVGLTQRNKRNDQSTGNNNPPSDFSTLGEGSG